MAKRTPKEVSRRLRGRTGREGKGRKLLESASTAEPNGRWRWGGSGALASSAVAGWDSSAVVGFVNSQVSG